MANIDIARLIVKDRFHGHIKKVFEQDKAEMLDLEANFSLPNPVPKLEEMTLPQLNALRQALSQQLIKLTMIESLVKRDMVRLETELESR